MKKFLIMLVVISILLAGCSQADVASHNLSTAAYNFEVTRRIIFYNGITNDYMLTIEGLCSLGNYDLEAEISVTCKVSPTEYKRHFLGLSDNVTYFAEQIEPFPGSVYHYRVIYRPSVIIPDIEIQ